MTKLNICVLGTSHTACYKNAWDAIKSAYSGVEVDFYPFHSLSNSRLIFNEFKASKKDGTLYIEHEDAKMRFEKVSGRKAKIQTKDVDLFLICGGVDIQSTADCRLYSRQVRELEVRNSILLSDGFALLKTIRSITDAKIYLTHIPFQAIRDLGKARRIGSYSDEVELLNSGPLGSLNAELLAQPIETFERKRETKLEYCVGYCLRKLRRGNGLETIVFDDLIHMNKAFGALAWVDLLMKAGISANKDNLMMPIGRGHLTLDEKHPDGEGQTGFKIE